MTHPGSRDVAQRRFWNMLATKPGVIHIGSWGGLGDNAALYAGYDNPDYDPVACAAVLKDGISEEEGGDYYKYCVPIYWYYVYSSRELDDAKIYPRWTGDRADWIELLEALPAEAAGCLPFPPEHKLARYWMWQYQRIDIPGLSGVDYNGTNEWIFKPYSTDWGLVGASSWAQGEDWQDANLFFDSSPYKTDDEGNLHTTVHYTAEVGWNIKGPREGLAVPWVYGGFNIAVGFGQGGLLYGYLNDHYFGNNEMGSNKPNEGEGPRWSSVGDLSKTFGGLWGHFGLSHGVLVWQLADVNAKWVFDLCDRPQQQFIANFNNQIYHLNETGEFQSEGWGTDVVSIHSNTIEFESGRQETYLQFTVDVSPARSTLNVYSMQGLMLHYGEDYIHDPCDKSGRSYRLLKEPPDPCKRYHALIVTYLVTADTLGAGRRIGRTTDPNVGHDRQTGGDIRGL